MGNAISVARSKSKLSWGRLQKKNPVYWEGLLHGCANHDTEEKRFKSPIHYCDVTKPPYLSSGKLCTSPLHCKLLFVYIVC